jgi:hypothetical protein
MTVKAQITENGRIAFDYELKPKDYKSGRKGYFAAVTIVLDGKVHRGNIMLYQT